MIVIQPLNLLVKNEKREGHRLFGYVVNGAWGLEITETEVLAKNGRVIETRQPIPENLRIIQVKKEDTRKHYNTILSMDEYQ